MKKMQMIFSQKKPEIRPTDNQTTLALRSKITAYEDKVFKTKDDSLRNFIGRIVHLRKSCSACGK